MISESRGNGRSEGTATIRPKEFNKESVVFCVIYIFCSAENYFYIELVC